MDDFVGRLWSEFGTLQITDLPTEVRVVARSSVLDWFGCALAGSGEPLVSMLCDEVARPDGECTLVGRDRRADVYRAAMVNGAAGHALDFDDTNTVMGGHPTAPLLPAVLAIAELERRNGAEMLVAYVVGSEIAARIGRAIGPEHYARGWHATSTIGVFGATAAVSWLLRLDERRFGHAIGIAASNASGLKANFGTMMKPLHAGQAAERGVMAARLAAAGFTANVGAIEAEQGLARASGSGVLDPEQIERWSGRWATTRTLFKFHAACHLTHASIEATRSILDQGVAADEIELVTLTVNPALLDVCGIAEPTTGLEAKFSLRGTQALLLDGADTAALETFADEPINAAGVRALLDRIEVHTDVSMSLMAARSAVRWPGGMIEAECDVGLPDSDLERQWRRLRRKFTALAMPVIGADATASLTAQLDDLELVPDVSALLLSC